MQIRLRTFVIAGSLISLLAGPAFGQFSSPTAPSPVAGGSRPLYVDGRVQFDDGSPANTNIRIERVCGGTVHLQGHTDSKGQFYFQINDNTQVDNDAATLSSGLSSPGVPDHSTMVPITGQRLSEIGCEIRAAYPGYRSDIYDVAANAGAEEMHAGTLMLHRIGTVTGTTLSVTTALAPKKAQKDYEKGMQLVNKGEFEPAERYMKQAVDGYPNYALALFALGQLQQKRGDLTDARVSYQSAIKADSHYISPYLELARLAAQEKKWDEALAYSKQTLSLNSAEFPSAYWFNAVANLQLGKVADAEQSLATLIKMDTAHQYVNAEDLIGRILLQKGDYAGAAEHLHAYLMENPNAADRDVVKRTLDKLAANGTPGAPPQQ